MKSLCVWACSVAGLLVACSTPKPNKPLAGYVDLQGHRGARGLHPENTLIAFKDCFTYDMTTIELDTTLTKDDQLIVHHDTKTNPMLCQTKDGKSIEEKRIREMTVETLKTYDCGSLKNPRFPEQKLVPGESLVTLDEFFAYVKNHEAQNPGRQPIRFNVEIKVDEKFTEAELQRSAEVMARAISAAGVVSRTTVQSFRLEILPMVHGLNNEITLAALYEPTYWQGLGLSLGLNANRSDILEKTISLGASIVSPYHMYVNHDFVAQAHGLGLQVIPWTVNEVEDMKRLIALGVDGLISDYPDRLRKVVPFSRPNQ